MTDAAPGGPLPLGTVTFLRTDVEGSMRWIQRLGSSWDEVNAAHLAIVRGAIEDHGGVVVRTEGDACFAAFAEARAAAGAAAAMQRGLASASFDGAEGLQVRVGLHTGEAHRAGDDYGGFEVNRAARIAAVGHGGQIVVSDTTRALIADALPDGTSLRDLGKHLLRDVPRPERLSQLDVDGLPTSFPPLRTGGAIHGNLPDRLTSFVGRDESLAAVVDLTREARLVTLTGPGGIGKTSLAIEAARALADRHPDGAWFVPLADLADATGLGGAIAHAIGLLDGPERSAASALLPYLAERSMVLVLDNLEHLLDGAETVAAVVRASPASRVIVTSRAPLHVAGEHEVAVPPLTDESVRLFIERARSARAGWQPGAEEEATVAEICRLVDDLPLGIELAAARVALLSPMVIRDRLAARAPLPGSGPRDAPARQRTLDSTVAWSHDLLAPERQALLHVLAVFDGGFDLEQVEAVAGGDRLDDLLDLAEQSLIVPSPAPPGRIRFRLLRTIGSFALQRLAASGREDETRRRHAQAYLDLVGQVIPHLSTSLHATWVERFAPDVANLRAAIRWAMDGGDPLLALRLTGSSWRLWHVFGLVAEARATIERLLAMPDTPTSGIDRARAEAAAGSLAYWQADPAAARRHYEAQVALATAAGDEAAVADGYFNLGHTLFIDGDTTLQREHVDSLIARYRDLGDELGIARAEWAFSIIAMGLGDVDEATRRLTMSRAEFARLDDRQYFAMTTASLSWAAFMGGDIGQACAYAVDALLESQAMRDLGTTTISLHVGVLMANMIGRHEEAARMHGAFDALCAKYGVRPPAALEEFIGGQDPFVAARGALDPGRYDVLYEEGRRMTLDEAVALVVELGDAAAAGSIGGAPSA